MKKLFLAIALIGVGYWFVGSDSTVALEQRDGSLTYAGYRFDQAEPIVMSGRVLSRRDYRTGRESDLSPTDFALGWGRLEDPAIASQFEFSQSNRWYFWRSQTLPIPKSEIAASAANVHLIPATDAVRDQLASVAVGDQVTLRGKLVDVLADDGWRWRSSRSRSDTGRGSCEVLLVDSVSGGRRSI